MFERYDTVVRCSDGHLFTTIWIPLVSVKAVRLYNKRYQRCPVGHHFSIVRRVDVDELDAAKRERAAAVRDIRIP
ncbi:MAG: hypothetical protein ABSG64_04055 [Solirubrobacteraceae bacterium]|jgi:hypothetical protein